MAKIVNAWNEWDPLKRVIMGRPEGTNVPAPEPAWQHDLPEGGFPLGQWGPFPQEMIDAANEQMDYFVSVLEKRGAVVDRVEIQPFMLNRPVSNPYWTQLNCYGVNNARDATLIHGNFVLEATMSRRARYWERMNLRPIFERYFREDPDVVHFAAPMPMLTDESYVRNYYHDFDHVWTEDEKREKLLNLQFQLTEKEPLFDAADGMRFGKDIFHRGSSLTNRAGLDWLTRMFAALGIRVHPVVFDSVRGKDAWYHPWHIDVNLVPLRPGLCMYNPDWPPYTAELWDLFKRNDWELVPAARPVHVHRNKVRVAGAAEECSWISMNTFSIDPKTVCVEAHETAYAEQLSRLGFEVVPIPYEKVRPFGGSLHCNTLDVYREGACEDYFPKQIAGY